MKIFILALLFVILTGPAFAQQKTPDVYVLPKQAVDVMLDYLNTRPRGEIEKLAVIIETCERPQIPDAAGLTSNRGECPPIDATLELIAKGRSVDALQKKVDDQANALAQKNEEIKNLKASLQGATPREAN